MKRSLLTTSLICSLGLLPAAPALAGAVGSLSNPTKSIAPKPTPLSQKPQAVPKAAAAMPVSVPSVYDQLAVYFNKWKAIDAARGGENRDTFESALCRSLVWTQDMTGRFGTTFAANAARVCQMAADGQLAGPDLEAARGVVRGAVEATYAGASKPSLDMTALLFEQETPIASLLYQTAGIAVTPEDIRFSGRVPNLLSDMEKKLAARTGLPAQVPGPSSAPVNPVPPGTAGPVGRVADCFRENFQKQGSGGGPAVMKPGGGSGPPPKDPSLLVMGQPPAAPVSSAGGGGIGGNAGVPSEVPAYMACPAIMDKGGWVSLDGYYPGWGWDPVRDRADKKLWERYGGGKVDDFVNKFLLVVVGPSAVPDPSNDYSPAAKQETLDALRAYEVDKAKAIAKAKAAQTIQMAKAVKKKQQQQEPPKNDTPVAAADAKQGGGKPSGASSNDAATQADRRAVQQRSDRLPSPDQDAAVGDCRGSALAYFGCVAVSGSGAAASNLPTYSQTVGGNEADCKKNVSAVGVENAGMPAPIDGGSGLAKLCGQGGMDFSFLKAGVVFQDPVINWGDEGVPPSTEESTKKAACQPDLVSGQMKDKAKCCEAQPDLPECKGKGGSGIGPGVGPMPK